MYSSRSAADNIAHKYFLVAFGLIALLAFTLLLCSLGLIAGLVISIWQFPLACLLSLAATCYAAKFFIPKAKGFIVKVCLAVIAITGISILFAGYFYDVSFDGQWYHQETVYNLKQGYNPAYQTLQIPPDEALINDIPNWCSGVDMPENMVKSSKPLLNSKFLSMNCFCKGAEMIEAAIYQDTHRIETGKCVNVMMLIASFFLCLSLFYRIDHISVRKKWLLSVLFAFNPIAVIQLLSFCVDGFVASLLLSLLVVMGLLFLKPNRYYLLLLSFLIIITVDVKYTTLVFTGMFGTGFLIFLLLYKQTATFKKVLLTGAISIVIGIFCCGFNPYVTNLVQKHNMFYGVEQTRNVDQGITPPLLRSLNRFEKLFLSISAHQGWHSADKRSIAEIPKIPFTINAEDIREAGDAEQQLSGFGPFFSGAMLIATGFFLFIFSYRRKTQAFKQGGYALLIIITTVIIVPLCWWARFVPQFWLIPVIILLMSELITFRYERAFKGIFYVSLGLNIAWAMLVIVSNISSTAHINYQMQQLKALNKPVKIEICNYQSFKSNQVRFMEAGIPFVEKEVTGPYIYNVVSSNTRFETPVPLPVLPKPLLLRLSELTGK